jgi:hypothetical protein
MIRGNIVFDGVTVGEGTFNFLQVGGAVTLAAKIAFVNSRTGNTHGWSTNATWSPDVLLKLQELKQLMEVDIARVHLVDGTMESDGPTARSTPADVGGLGESFNDPIPSA